MPYRMIYNTSTSPSFPPASRDKALAAYIVSTLTESITKFLLVSRVKNAALKQRYEQHKNYGSNVHSILEETNAVTDFPIFQHVVTTKMFEFSQSSNTVW